MPQSANPHEPPRLQEPPANLNQGFPSNSAQSLPAYFFPPNFPPVQTPLASPWTQVFVEYSKPPSFQPISASFPQNAGPSPRSMLLQSADELNHYSPATGVPVPSPELWHHATTASNTAPTAWVGQPISPQQSWPWAITGVSQLPNINNLLHVQTPGSAMATTLPPLSAVSPSHHNSTATTSITKPVVSSQQALPFPSNAVSQNGAKTEHHQDQIAQVQEPPINGVSDHKQSSNLTFSPPRIDNSISLSNSASLSNGNVIPAENSSAFASKPLANPLDAAADDDNAKSTSAAAPTVKLHSPPKIIPRRKPNLTSRELDTDRSPRLVAGTNKTGSPILKRNGKSASQRRSEIRKEPRAKQPRSERYWLDQQVRLLSELEKQGFKAQRTGKDTFNCSICDKDFETKLLCVRHAVEHLGYKPFQCTACGMEFTRCDTLQRHLKARCLVLQQKELQSSLENVET